MIFAAPVVGKFLEAFASTALSASVEGIEGTNRSSLQASASRAADQVDFAQTLDNVEQSAASKNHVVNAPAS